MELYVSPFACSFAARVVIYEAGLEHDIRLRSVDIRTHRLSDGEDYLAVHPLGQVPALLTRERRLLTENLAILLYIADSARTASLAPCDGHARYELLQWLSFIGSELHMRVFKALVSPTSNEGAREAARAAAPIRLKYLDEHLSRSNHLLREFSAADAALIAILNWAGHVRMDLGPYPAIHNYYQCQLKRPSVARAIAEEMKLFAPAAAANTSDQAGIERDLTD
jgi:glutathione S-transferase